MLIDEYTNAFTNKMEFTLHLVANELTKINMYSQGLPWDQIVPDKQEPTFEASIWVVKSVEGMMQKREAYKAEVGEKGQLMDSQETIATTTRRRSSPSQTTNLEATGNGSGATSV